MFWKAADLANCLTIMVRTSLGRHDGANTDRTLGSQLATPYFDSYRIHLERPLGETIRVRNNFGSDVDTERRRDGISGATSKRERKPQTKRKNQVPNNFGIAIHVLRGRVESIVFQIKTARKQHRLQHE